MAGWSRQRRDSRGRFASGNEDPLAGLAGEAQAAADALGDLGDAAKAAQPALKGAGDGAAGLAGKVGEAGEKADEAAQKTAIFTTALGNLAASGLERAGEALAEWAANLPEAAARAEAHQRVLEQLGAAYGVVQQATNGAVSAEQAAAVQQRALQSGLRLSAQELAAVTSRAREFSRATGTDLNQALEQLTDQLVDPGEELRKFGVFLQTGMNAGDALRETLRQLQAQTASTATSQTSLNEAMEQAKRATTEATDALAAQLAKQLELREFFTQLASWITDAKNATNGWDEAVTAVTGTLREMIGLRSQASAQAGQAGQSASGQFTGEAGALMQQARGRGLNFGGFEIGHLGVDATPEQRNRVMALMRRAALGQLDQRTLDIELSGFDAEVSITRDDRERQQREAAAAAEAARRRELARRNRASSSSSSSSSTAQLPSGFGIGSEGFLTDYARNAYEMIRARVLAARSPAEPGRALPNPRQSIERSLAEIEQRRAGDTASVELAGAGVSRGGFLGGALSRDAGRAEVRERTERIRILREQRDALGALLTEAKREEEIARASGRPIAEVNALIQQRIGIQTALTQSTRDLVAAQEEQVSGFAVVGEKLLGVLEGVADGVGESVVAALEGSKGFGEAMEEMVRSTLRALAKLAIVEALKEGAMAVAAAATYRYDAAVQHGISAGLWAGVGIAAGAGVAAMGTGQKPAASSGGGAARASGEGGGRAARADERAASGGPLTIVMNVSGAAFTDAGVQHAATAAIREAVGNGVLRREHLGGLLGD